jgi:hypothetical protein
MRHAIALFGLLIPAVAASAPMYRVDLVVAEEGKPVATPLVVLEAGKDASIAIDGPDGGRRYEVRVDAEEDASGRIAGAVTLRVVDLTPGGEHELGRDVIEMKRLGVPYAWEPAEPTPGLEIKLTLYRQPL